MVTEFQKSVYKVLKKVPKGKVTTYGDIAKKLKNFPRAVGNALNKNPYGYYTISPKAVRNGRSVTKGKIEKNHRLFYAISSEAIRNRRSMIRGDSKRTSGFFLVPCHRVIKTNGQVGGFSTGKENKIKLLKKEGIKIKKEKIDLKKYGFKF